MRATNLSPILHKPNHIQRLFNIRDLLAQSLAPSLRVYFHELVFRDHFLEGSEGGFDFCARRDIVAYIVNEGGDGNAAGVCLRCYCAGCC